MNAKKIAYYSLLIIAYAACAVALGWAIAVIGYAIGTGLAIGW